MVARKPTAMKRCTITLSSTGTFDRIVITSSLPVPQPERAEGAYPSARGRGTRAAIPEEGHQSPEEHGEQPPAEVGPGAQSQALGPVETRRRTLLAGGRLARNEVRADVASEDVDVGPDRTGQVSRAPRGRTRPARRGGPRPRRGRPPGRCGVGGQPPQLVLAEQGGGHDQHDDTTTTSTAQTASSSEERKNCAKRRTPRATPDHALWRWRIRISSRTARMSGSSISAAVIRCANSRLVSTKGEKP